MGVWNKLRSLLIHEEGALGARLEKDGSDMDWRGWMMLSVVRAGSFLQGDFGVIVGDGEEEFFSF